MPDARTRMATEIERRAIERGRHLTAQEQLENLASALAEDEGPCPLCGVRDDEVCGFVLDGETCRLEPDDA